MRKLTASEWLGKVMITKENDDLILAFAGIKFARVNLAKETIVAEGKHGVEDLYTKAFIRAILDEGFESWGEWIEVQNPSK